MALFKSGGSVGLDLDSGVIRAVELKRKAKNVVLAAAGRVEIPFHAVAEGIIADVDAVAGALKKLWKDSRISGREVTVGLSNQGVLMRMARLPKVPEKHLARVIHYQAGDYFPIPLDQMVLDFSLTGEVAGENGPEMEVLLVAARRDMLDRYLDVLSLASLRPLVVDASSLALLRVMPEEHQAKTAAVLDISSGWSCSLLIAEKGVPRLARDISQSLSPFRETGRSPGPDEDVRGLAAAALDGDLPPAAAHGGDEGWLTALVNEVRSTIGYYHAQRSAEPVGLLFLSGAGARRANLPAVLEEELDLPVEVARPLAALNGPLPESCSFINTEEPDFAVCFGLALRGLESK
ncbi:MAG: type IV pilus assembly protein PilM [Firmicutes bacterium]|nr:type IV pilus assembly protein PilM [Bacillota bacterium]